MKIDYHFSKKGKNMKNNKKEIDPHYKPANTTKPEVYKLQRISDGVIFVLDLKQTEQMLNAHPHKFQRIK